MLLVLLKICLAWVSRGWTGILNSHVWQVVLLNQPDSSVHYFESVYMLINISLLENNIIY